MPYLFSLQLCIYFYQVKSCLQFKQNSREKYEIQTEHSSEAQMS